MTSSWQVEVSRSTADWASSWSCMRPSHSTGGPVGGDDGGVVAVPGDGQLVEVGGGGLVQRLECKIVDQQVHRGQPAVLGFGAVVQPGGFEALEQVAGAGHVHGEAAADGDVAQRGGQVGLADPDGYPRF